MAKKWIALLLGVVVLAAVWAYTWQRRTNRAFQGRLAALESENLHLRTRLAALRAATPAPVPAPRAAASVPPQPAGPGTDEYLEAVRTVSRLQKQLDDTKAQLESVSVREQQLEAQTQKLGADNQRLTASEQDLNTNLSSANNVIAALQRELKTKSQRLVEIEVEAERLRDQSRSDRQRAQNFAQLTAQLEQLHRRRENYLDGILRRYKDVTDQYRSLAGMMNDRSTDAAPITTADVSRIQDTLSQAEDDMRQVNSLNAQAQRLEKKLAGK